MFHQITLVGNLGMDPELRYTPGGDAVTNFSVATNRRWTGQDGQPAEQTTWFRISVWGTQAEACNKYLEKGRQVLVVGEMNPDRETGNPRTWTDNNANVRASYEVRARTVQFLGGAGGQSQAGPSSSASVSAPASNGVTEDEIPF